MSATDPGHLIRTLAATDEFIDLTIETARAEPITTGEMADHLLEVFWLLACKEAEGQDDKDPNHWGPTLLALALATAIQRLAGQR